MAFILKGVYTKRLNFEHALENVWKIKVIVNGGDDLNSICRIVINHTAESFDSEMFKHF